MVYFNETYRIYSLPGPRDVGDIFKVVYSKFKVTSNIPKIHISG